MNASKFRAIAIFSLMTALGPLSLNAQGPVHFNIPFDFTVQSRSFAAGDYEVSEVSHQIVHLRSGENGTTGILLSTIATDPGKRPGVATMTFHRYGNSYFLAEIAQYGHGWGLRKSPAEKEVIARLADGGNISVIASSRK